MNAHARIEKPREVRCDETVAERAHSRSISVHLPNLDRTAMSVRCEIAAYRDAASAGLSKAGPHAASLLHEVVRLSGPAVHSSLPTSKLMRIRWALELTMMAAREIERVTRDG